MAAITLWHHRIIPLREVLKAVGRSFWYLRTFLILLALLISLSALLLMLAEKDSQPSSGVEPVRNYGEALFLSLAAATSIDTGNLGVVSPLGRVFLLIDGLLGLTLLGIVIWVIQFCLGETGLRVSQFLLFASDKEATIKN